MSLYSFIAAGVSTVTSLFAQSTIITNPRPQACTASANLAVDPFGPMDTRPDTWGHADAKIFPMIFHPPMGFRRRILEVNGDLVSWPKIIADQPPVGAGAFAPAPSAQVNPCPVKCSASANFSVDNFGEVDTRGSVAQAMSRGHMAKTDSNGGPDIWGRAGVTTWPLTFKPPVGYRVRILTLSGDLVSWPKVLPGQPPVAAGSYAGVLLGFQSTADSSKGQVLCDYCASEVMLYIQDGVTDKCVRTPFNQDVSAGGLLEADNKLIIKVAQWLNTTGYPIHMEPTFTVTFRYEAID